MNQTDIAFGANVVEDNQSNETRVITNISSPSVAQINFSTLVGRKIIVLKYTVC